MKLAYECVLKPTARNKTVNNLTYNYAKIIKFFCSFRLIILNGVSESK